MTPFEELGYKETDEFRVITDDVNDSGFTTDDIIILYRDDGTAFPAFSLKANKRHKRYVQLCNIEKVELEKAYE